MSKYTLEFCVTVSGVIEFESDETDERDILCAAADEFNWQLPPDWYVEEEDQFEVTKNDQPN